jgi:hypothetical protein
MVLKKPCLYCGKEFEKSYPCSMNVWNNRKKYCSKKCYSLAMIGKHPWNYQKKGCFTDEQNEKRIETRRKNAKERGFWERKETGIKRTESRKRTCELRGYWIPEDTLMRRSKAMKGTHLSKETIEKMKKPYTEERKERNILMRNTEEFKQNQSKALLQYYAKNPHPPMSIEQRIKISKSLSGRGLGWKKGNKPWNTDLTKETDLRLKIMAENFSGYNHPNFQNWKSRELYGYEFNPETKEKIRQKDGYVCQQCGIKQEEYRTKTGKKRKLIIHHIDYNKKNNNTTNLISLCLDCHMETNYNRKEWKEYFQARMELLNINILNLQEPENIILEMI